MKKYLSTWYRNRLFICCGQAQRRKKIWIDDADNILWPPTFIGQYILFLDRGKLLGCFAAFVLSDDIKSSALETSFMTTTFHKVFIFPRNENIVAFPHTAVENKDEKSSCVYSALLLVALPSCTDCWFRVHFQSTRQQQDRWSNSNRAPSSNHHFRPCFHDAYLMDFVESDQLIDFDLGATLRAFWRPVFDYCGWRWDLRRPSLNGDGSTASAVHLVGIVDEEKFSMLQLFTWRQKKSLQKRLIKTFTRSFRIIVCS